MSHSRIQPTSAEAFEKSKENIIPLKKGRNAGMLSQALRTPSRELEATVQDRIRYRFPLHCYLLTLPCHVFVGRCPPFHLQFKLFFFFDLKFFFAPPSCSLPSSPDLLSALSRMMALEIRSSSTFSTATLLTFLPLFLSNGFLVRELIFFFKMPTSGTFNTLKTFKSLEIKANSCSDYWKE